MLNLLKFFPNPKNRLNQSDKYITLSQVRNGEDVKINRHFPSSTKSWFNSIYSYDKNVVKSMPFLDKIVNNVIRMYFNLNSNANINKKFSRRRTRERRLSVKKIFVSKAEIKHSNDKVIINLYTYNRTKKFFFKKLSKLYRRIFSYIPTPNFLFKQIVSTLKNYNLHLSYEDKKNIMKFFHIAKSNNKKFRHLKKEYRWNKEYKKYAKLFLYRYFSNFYKNFLEFYTYDNFTYLNFKYISIRGSIVFDRFLSRSSYIFKLLRDKKLYRVINTFKGRKLPFIFKFKNLKVFDKYTNEYYNTFIKETLRKEMLYLNYNQLLKTDAYKFNSIYLSRLSDIISKIYKKKIEFNIINLKYMHLDSRIFSESIALKIRNRKNKLTKILRKALTFQKINRDKTYKNSVQKMYIHKYNNSNKYEKCTISNSAKKDTLHYLFNNLFNTNNVTPIFSAREKYIYRSIRFRKIRGVRLEAKGRLTRRLTASRAIFKLRCKGSLQNLDSSINGLSSIILRGSLKSNIDYVNLNSKTRNGCFGLKGWISSK